MHKFGVMQGRLVPKYLNRYQFHPVDYWQEEFEIAKDLSLDLIEFIYDFDSLNDNPLTSKEGRSLISEIIEKTSVGVETICADYFMRYPLHASDQSISSKSLDLILDLHSNCKEIGVNQIIIPLVDSSSIKKIDYREKFILKFNDLLSQISSDDVKFVLETDLPPNDFLQLINNFDNKILGVNYDSGNSASLGYNPNSEFDAYHKYITDIHIKDRVYKGGPVFLGEGAAKISLIIDLIFKYKYKGPIIFQLFRDDEGLEIFKLQKDLFMSLYNEKKI